jgi:hypothetical protein
MRNTVDTLRAENARLQSVNDQLKHETDRMESQVAHAHKSASAYRDERDDAQHDLAETRRALVAERAAKMAAVEKCLVCTDNDNARAGAPMSRLDHYVLAVFGKFWTNPMCDIVANAKRLMDAADRPVQP